MITHVVTLQWKDDLPDGHIAMLMEALYELPALVPSMRTYRMGADLGLVPAGNSSFAIVATFDDIDGFRAYDVNERHEQIRADLIRPWLAARSAAQFET